MQNSPSPESTNQLDVRDRLKKHKNDLIREEILSAAARLFSARGFRAVTVDEISSEMGFSKSIVYYHMQNKHEILCRIFEKIDNTYRLSLDECLGAGGTATERLDRVLRMHILNVLSHTDWSTVYNRDEYELPDDYRKVVRNNRRNYNSKIQDLYSEGVNNHEFINTPPVIAVSCLIGACNWPYTWFNRSGHFTAQEIADGYAKQLINGVATRHEHQN